MDGQGERLVTIKAAAARLELSASSLYALLAKGELPCVRIGGSTRILESDLVEFMRRHRVPACEDAAQEPAAMGAR